MILRPISWKTVTFLRTTLLACCQVPWQVPYAMAAHKLFHLHVDDESKNKVPCGTLSVFAWEVKDYPRH